MFCAKLRRVLNGTEEPLEEQLGDATILIVHARDGPSVVVVGRALVGSISNGRLLGASIWRYLHAARHQYFNSLLGTTEAGDGTACPETRAHRSLPPSKRKRQGWVTCDVGGVDAVRHRRLASRRRRVRT